MRRDNVTFHKLNCSSWNRIPRFWIFKKETRNLRERLAIKRIGFVLRTNSISFQQMNNNKSWRVIRTLQKKKRDVSTRHLTSKLTKFVHTELSVAKTYVKRLEIIDGASREGGVQQVEREREAGKQIKYRAYSATFPRNLQNHSIDRFADV